MRVTLLAITLLSTILLSTINPSKSECCKYHIKCENSGKTTYRCYDCTEATTIAAYCGKGKCNAFGCNCDGGCRQGDSTMSCWNLASGCKMVEFYDSSNAQNIFDAIDTDSDGKVSFTEAKNYINENIPTGVDVNAEFTKLDANNDGFLAVNEIDGY